MTRKRESAAASAEIVPLSRAETKAELRNSLKSMVAQMVEEQVAAAMSGAGAELQPFFGSKEVAYEIKRRQTVHEQNKHAYFFEDNGCMICHTKKVPHHSAGMCNACYSRISSQMSASLRRRASAKDSAQPDFMDSVRMARAALAPSVQTAVTEATPRRRAK